MSENWYALRVKSRHESVTAGELTRKKIVNFLPAVARTRQWKDRKKVVDFPLFPGYLFVHIAPEPALFLDVVKTRGSVGFVSLEPGHPSSIAPEDIVCLKTMLACGEPIDVYPTFKEGMSVRVKRGPLSSAFGILIKKEECHIFLVNFAILGRSVGLKICADDVELA
jgi:transcription termination/antitermination protein NusG